MSSKPDCGLTAAAPQADIVSDVSPVNPHCVCSIVADYNDSPFGPSVEEALADWPFDKGIIKVSGPFSRAGGFQVILDKGVWTEPRQSLVYFMDADMIAYPGFMQRTMTYGTWMPAANAPLALSSRSVHPHLNRVTAASLPLSRRVVSGLRTPVSGTDSRTMAWHIHNQSRELVANTTARAAAGGYGDRPRKIDT